MLCFSRTFACALVGAIVAYAPILPGQAAPHVKLDSIEVDHARGMLRDARDDVRKNYYDPTFHGIDLDARYKEYDDRIKNAGSLPELLEQVAAFLSGFNDSHLFFLPPARGAHFDAGYRMQMVGDDCFITRVRPGSDAADKLMRGDQVMQFGQYAVNRKDLSDLNYYFHLLAPAPVEQLVVKSPTGPPHTMGVKPMMKRDKAVIDITRAGADSLDLETQQEQREFLYRERFITNDHATIWKMAEFGFEDTLLDELFSPERSRPYLIIDLRGNPGGYTDSLQFLVGRLFDHDVKISDRVGRKPYKPQLAKHIGKPYNGKVIVLIDSNSASSAELFARVMQLEHRGVVIGDTSAGAVMEAIHYDENLGEDTRVFFGFSITRANLLMADGKSLEKTGVTPDELLLPTASDLQHGYDPVMAHAMAIAGITITPAEAGKLFPYEWAKF